MSMKARYASFCEEKDLPVFYHPYWLDAVCDKGHWDVVIDEDKGGNIRGVMPYYKKSKFGYSLIVMPMLTPYLGICFNYPENMVKRERIYAFEHEVSHNLISSLPSSAYFNVAFNPDFQNWMTFKWQGYKQTTRYTFVISVDDVNSVYERIKSKTRNVIRKAEEKLSIKEDDINSFMRLNKLTFQRQNMDLPYSADSFIRLDEQLKSKNVRKIYSAVDENDHPHASIYTVEDNRSTYLIGVGSDPAYRESGAISLLIWHAIQQSIQSGKVFDFEGSTMQNIEPLYRSFGGKMVPYFQIYKSINKLTDAVLSFLGKF